MEVSLTQIWASPSTLHLRLVITGKGGKWIRFHNLHIPLSEVDETVSRALEAAHRTKLAVVVEEPSLFDSLPPAAPGSAV